MALEAENKCHWENLIAQTQKAHTRNKTSVCLRWISAKHCQMMQQCQVPMKHLVYCCVTSVCYVITSQFFCVYSQLFSLCRSVSFCILRPPVSRPHPSQWWQEDEMWSEGEEVWGEGWRTRDSVVQWELLQNQAKLMTATVIVYFKQCTLEMLNPTVGIQR